MEELHVIFSGRVQGVGFRWTVVDEAETFGLKGTVCNLMNGGVEVFAQGERASLEAFLEAVHHHAGAARIESVKKEFRKPRQPYEGFTIIYSR